MTNNRNEALRLLREFLTHHNIDVANIDKIDRRRHYRIFELCAAYELDVIMWDQLSPDVVKLPELRTALTARGGKLRDFGIDCASADLRHAVQVKWYAPGKTVSVTSIATFFTLATLIGAKKLTLVLSKNVKIAKVVANGLPITKYVIDDDKIRWICHQALLEPVRIVPITLGWWILICILLKSLVALIAMIFQCQTISLVSNCSN
jgi:hypothetical protein